jgi:pyrroloquinoline quinone (PQQ) biosynthesis protein C
MAHPFFLDMQKGVLPFDKIQQFFRNWYAFALEVNTAAGTIYHRFVPLFKQYPDLEDIITEKIADEFGQPLKGGHIRTLEKTAASLGVSKNDLVFTEITPGARAWTDYIVRLTTEGTLAEYYAMSIWEGNSGYWSGAFSKALLTHYIKTGTSADEPYMSTHAEADLDEHEGGMGHGDQAKYTLQRLYELGEAKFRPGWSPEYCIWMCSELMTMVEDDIYRGVTVDGELRKLGVR